MVAVVRRQSSSATQPNAENTFSKNIWIPVAVIVGCIILISLGTWARRRAHRSMAPTPTTTSTNGTTVTGANGASQGTAPRARRNRRRASQISTKSLPVYMEEAGDEEVVLVSRQRGDPMPTLAENAMRPSMDSDETMADEHVGTPLLERDPNFSNAVPPENVRSPLSAASAHSPGSDDAFVSGLRDGTGAVHPGLPAAADVRGDAPAYFEAVADDRTGEVTAHRTFNGSPTSPDASNTNGATLNRSQSLFRTLFTRGADQTSPTSQDGQGQQSSTRHRPSGSLSSLRPSLSLYRSRSNESNDENRSSIALHNISAPIAHTLVRTEFTYPKTGPTEQQLKFLASRESLGRFGLPFGDEARADPPSFETVIGPSSSSVSLHTTNANGHGRRPSFASSMYPPGTEEQDISTLPITAHPLSASPPEAPPPATSPAPRAPEVVHPRLPDIVTSHPTPPATSPPSPAAAQPDAPAQADHVSVVAAAA